MPVDDLLPLTKVEQEAIQDFAGGKPMPKKPLIHCSPSYGSMEIHWRQPTALSQTFKSRCSSCGQDQQTTGGAPLWCDACLKKLGKV